MIKKLTNFYQHYDVNKQTDKHNEQPKNLRHNFVCHVTQCLYEDI